MGELIGMSWLATVWLPEATKPMKNPEQRYTKRGAGMFICLLLCCFPKLEVVCLEKCMHVIFECYVTWCYCAEAKHCIWLLYLQSWNAFVCLAFTLQQCLCCPSGQATLLETSNFKRLLHGSTKDVFATLPPFLYIMLNCFLELGRWNVLLPPYSLH